MYLATRAAHAAFADLAYADREWLAAEFDALISASFSEPPAPPRAAPPQVPPRPGTPRRPYAQVVPGPDLGAFATIGLGYHRQRSPPGQPPRGRASTDPGIG